jgi:hypothetical protein
LGIELEDLKKKGALPLVTARVKIMGKVKVKVKLNLKVEEG